MLKFVMMPPQTDQKREWARRLAADAPQFSVVVPESDAEARDAIVDADGAFGWVPPEALKLANRLRWLQNPDAGPKPGYFYDALIEHPVVVANPRGIYSDHISVHIMMFLLALSRGLPDYVQAQNRREWDKDAARHPFVYLREATALIVGVGGIGAETARLCSEFGMEVIGRGKTTKLDDLADAVEQGVIAGCGLDVFETEPLPKEHKLWGLPNVLITPHIAVRDGVHVEERRYQMILENARRFAAGEPLKNVVDKAAWF